MIARSLDLCNILANNHDFFQTLDPSTWQDNFDYVECENRCSNLVVINDAAERAVAMAEENYKKFTNNEDEWQRLLVGIFNHRQNYKKFTKSSLL